MDTIKCLLALGKISSAINFYHTRYRLARVMHVIKMYLVCRYLDNEYHREHNYLSFIYILGLQN